MESSSEKPVLHLISSVDYPERLGEVAASLVPLLTRFDVHWQPVQDERGVDVGGGRKHNTGLNRIHTPGWTYFLDDDNLLHPAFATSLCDALSAHPDARMFVFHQCEKDGTFRAYSDTHRIRLGDIDVAQFVIHTDAIGTLRWVEDDSRSDFIFAEAVAMQTIPVFIPVVACNYHALRL